MPLIFGDATRPLSISVRASLPLKSQMPGILSADCGRTHYVDQRRTRAGRTVTHLDKMDVDRGAVEALAAA